MKQIVKLIVVLVIVVAFIAIERYELTSHREIIKFIRNSNLKEWNFSPNEGKREKKYVFFDLGVNNGDSLLRFFNIRNKGNVGGDLMYTRFGSDARWIAYGFEANPKFNLILSQIRKELAKNHTIHMFTETAAWTYDGTIDFYLDVVNVNHDFWGSSLNKDHQDVVRSNMTKVTVPCKDIASLLKQYDPDDLVIVKMDVEGAEYDLVLDFIKKDVLRLIDYLAIEYHRNLSKMKSPESVFYEIFQLFGTKFVNWN